MANSVSINPALQRLAMVIAMFVTCAVFATILIEIGKANKHFGLCISNKTLIKTCWDWHFENYQRTVRCPFMLLFVSLVLQIISILTFFWIGFMKCLCPKVMLISNRNIFCRFTSQYLVLVLHLSGSIFAVTFIAFVLIYSFDKNSCYYSADIMRNCTKHRSLCWMLCLLFFGFVGCLFATMLSAFEARKFRLEKLDDDMCTQLYQNVAKT